MPTARNPFQLIILVALVYAIIYMAYTLISSGRNLPPVVATAITSRLSELSDSWTSIASNLPVESSQQATRSIPIEAPVSPEIAPPTGTSPQKTYYRNLAWQDAVDAGIPPDLFVRQINQESGFNTNEISPAGAVGIAQFLPSTAAGLGVDPWDPVSALRGAAQLMANYQRNYSDYRKALAAYNGGSGTLHYCMTNYGSAWLSCEPSETQNYVHIIMNN